MAFHLIDVLRVRLVSAAAIFVFLGLFLSAASACERASLATDPSINPADIDQARLTVEVLTEVNYHRCRANRRPLGVAPGALISSALEHSRWMAQSGQLTHNGRGASGRRMTDRVRTARISAASARENIAFLPRFQFGTDAFRVISRENCTFQTANGTPIPAHGYRSLAREVVDMWMQSSGHRRNLMARDISDMAVAAAFAHDRTCGTLWITQILIG